MFHIFHEQKRTVYALEDLWSDAPQVPLPDSTTLAIKCSPSNCYDMSDWYYAVNNEQKGPVNESDLKTQLATGKLPPDSLVWKDGMDNWTPASQVAAFSFREPPVPASFAKLSPTPATVACRRCPA